MGWQYDCPRAITVRRLGPRKPSGAAMVATRRYAAGFSSASIAACGGLCDCPRGAHALGTHRKRRHARAHGHSVGQRRSRISGLTEDRYSGAGHAERAAARTRPPQCMAQAAAYGPAKYGPALTKQSTHGHTRCSLYAILAWASTHTAARYSCRVSQDLPHDPGGRYRGGFPDRIARANEHVASAQAALLLRSGHRSRDCAPRPHSRRHGAPLFAAASGPRTCRQPFARARRCSRPHTGRAHLSRTSHAGRHDCCWFYRW